MEIKENYITVITNYNAENKFDINYDNLSSKNIISVSDVNTLVSDINTCLTKLSSLCTDQFCQLCQNGGWITTIVDNHYKRVKSFNGVSGAITATFADSKINNQALSTNTSINLLTFDPKKGYKFVTSLNGSQRSLSGIEKITINGNEYGYSKSNKGIVNLGGYKQINEPILKTINGVNGHLHLPIGVIFEEKYTNCNIDGTIDLTELFKDKVLTVNDTVFNRLYIETVGPRDESIINLDYLNNNSIFGDFCSIRIGTTITANTAATFEITESNDILAILYGIQDNVYKSIKEVESVSSTDITKTFNLKFNEVIQGNKNLNIFYLKRGK